MGPTIRSLAPSLLLALLLAVVLAVLIRWPPLAMSRGVQLALLAVMLLAIGVLLAQVRRAENDDG